MRAPVVSPLVSVYEPLLGTRVEFRVHATTADAALMSQHKMLDEVQRLERVFSAFGDSSELCRWRRGEVFATSPEFNRLLQVALTWQLEGSGTFNPAAGELGAVWSDAGLRDEEPDPGMLATIAARIAAPRYVLDRNRAVPVADCSMLTFNAIAKGFIVDAALSVGAAVDGVTSVTTNAGGDLAHRGVGSLAVGIENPATPYDNAPLLMIVDIADCGLATSGSARRGVRIGDRWFGHVLDPRTGATVDHIRSATVIAPDCTTADAIATIVGVLAVAEGIAFADRHDDIACCLVDRDGQVHRSARWDQFERPRSRKFARQTTV